MFYKGGKPDDFIEGKSKDELDNLVIPETVTLTPEQQASAEEEQRRQAEAARQEEENFNRLNYLADILLPKLLDFIDNPHIFLEENGEEFIIPKYPSFEALKQSFANTDNPSFEAMQWFEDSGFLEEISGYRSYYFVAKKLFDIFSECLKDYLGSTPYAEVFSTSQWIVHAISATFSILIIKLNIPSTQSLSNRADLVFEGISIARLCMYTIMDINNKNHSYEPVTVFKNLIDQTYSDIFLKNLSVEELNVQDKLLKVLDIILLNKSYEGYNHTVSNCTQVFFRLFAGEQTLEYNYKPLLNDISKTTLIFGIFPVIDTFFSVNTLTQRNSLIEELWVRINIIWDFLFNKPLVSINTRVIIRQILTKLRTETVSVHPRFYKTYSEDILVNEIVKQKSFKQLIYPKVLSASGNKQTQGEFKEPEVDLISTFSRLSYGILRYILKSTLDLLLNEFARQHAIVDTEFGEIINAYTWKTLHYLMCYFEQPDTIQGATPEEVEFFGILNEYINSDFKTLSQNQKNRLTILEQQLLLLKRPILIPTDWAALISLLINSPLIELRDVLRNRYENSIDDIYGCIFASIKAFYKSMHELFYLNNSQTTLFDDPEASLVLSGHLENLLMVYYPNQPALNAEVNSIREQVMQNFQIPEEVYRQDGLLKLKIWTQALYNLNLASQGLQNLPKGFVPEDFINPENDSQETFDLLEMEQFPESLLVMTLLTGNENQIRYIFPFFKNTKEPLCIEYLKTYEKACSHKEDEK